MCSNSNIITEMLKKKKIIPSDQNKPKVCALISMVPLRELCGE